jgi:hypothetical protein
MPFVFVRMSLSKTSLVMAANAAGMRTLELLKSRAAQCYTQQLCFKLIVSEFFG